MAVINGTAASQLLNGTPGDDTINGLGGNDTLRGGDGNDTYVFSGAFGSDLVRDTSGTDQIRFTADHGPQDFRLFRNFNQLVIDQVNGSNRVTLENFFSTGAGIETVVFERTGTVWDLQGGVFLSVGYTGTSGADLLEGSAFDERFVGLGGNDRLRGGDGNDVYVFSGAFGADAVRDTSGVDVVVIGADFSERDFRFERNFNDLVMRQIGGSNSVTFDNQFTTGSGIESILFARTGTVIQLDGGTTTLIPGFFDYAGYLAANPDVAATGLDAYQHYDAFGWREGRDPSAQFDTRLYLQANPDVAAAGINPLAHFLANGQAEGRQAADSFGLTVNGFDRTFYLLANPDVAAVGMDPLAHYSQFGWREGRDPNAIFTTSFYRNANPDVATADINPLMHYNASGWREGRDPSAVFSTTAYLNANPDVLAAGMQPMDHYINNGVYEGRSLGNGATVWML
ncbi:calcium-binding protein [Falsiroseomonas sp. E2-1-a20]|uniref:calcium-binding protein n=1 Tax=Falsiroseomonas sp. E2-1-a20 TaxID=3239300 RepID=UPI003F2CEFC8